MDYLLAHSMHGPSAFFGFALLLAPIPLCWLIWKRSQQRDKANKILAEEGARRYQAYLAAQAAEKAGATNGAATNGAGTSGTATNGAANGTHVPTAEATNGNGSVARETSPSKS